MSGLEAGDAAVILDAVLPLLAREQLRAPLPARLRVALQRLADVNVTDTLPVDSDIRTADSDMPAELVSSVDAGRELGVTGRHVRRLARELGLPIATGPRGSVSIRRRDLELLRDRRRVA